MRGRVGAKALGTHADLIRRLERQPLRNTVLLKHLTDYPDHARGTRVATRQGSAALVLLDARVSPYDRGTYPTAALVALLVSDGPDLTRRLLAAVPQGIGVVFKLATRADRDIVASRFALERGAGFLSFTMDAPLERDATVRIGGVPGEAALSLFEAQGHARAWLLPRLATGRAFVCSIGTDEAVGSACFAVESHGSVWEVSGVVTVDRLRGRGLAGRVVRTALAVLAERNRTARYQAQDNNHASLRVARKLRLQHFLTLEHYLHVPPEPGRRD